MPAVEEDYMKDEHIEICSVCERRYLEIFPKRLASKKTKWICRTCVLRDTILSELGETMKRVRKGE